MAGDSSLDTRTRKIRLIVNGKQIESDVNVRMTLAEFLRERLRLTGTKVGCNRGECGSCTVILDGRTVYSCTVLAVEAEGKEVFTVEGLTPDGQALHPLQASFIEHDALQCGYCTPGMLMSLKALLDANPSPTPEDIRQSIDGHLCRCGSYSNIIKAVLATAAKPSD